MKTKMVEPLQPKVVLMKTGASSGGGLIFCSDCNPLLDKRLLFGFGGESFYGSNAMCLVQTNFPRIQMAEIVKKVMVLS